MGCGRTISDTTGLQTWRCTRSLPFGAWSMRFMQDDAFISFRYAQNLAQGRGLVFNAGERVEGYTNFLWTVLMAIPERFGWSTPLFSQILGIALMLATVAVTLRLAKNVFGDATLAFLAAIVLLTNMTFLSYATGGLETMLETVLVVGVAALLLPSERAIDLRSGRDVRLAVDDRVTLRLVGAGVLAGLAVLTRLDAAVLVGTIFIVHVYSTARRSDANQRVGVVVRSTLAFGLPALVLIAPWFAWKFSYYGELLPNTFFAKEGGKALWPIAFGLLYLAAFFVGYFLFLLIGRWSRSCRYLHWWERSSSTATPMSPARSLSSQRCCSRHWVTSPCRAWAIR